MDSLDLIKTFREVASHGSFSRAATKLDVSKATVSKYIAELETRLSELQLPQQERILAYEKRIAELESELVSRKEEMRELVRVTLTLVRQRLDEEKKKPAPRNGVKPTPTS